MHNNKLILSVVAIYAALTAAVLLGVSVLFAQYTVPLEEPIVLPGPTITEIEIISVQVFPNAKRLEVHARAGRQVISAVRTGEDYDAIIAEVDVEALTALFVSDLAASVAALANED